MNLERIILREESQTKNSEKKRPDQKKKKRIYIKFQKMLPSLQRQKVDQWLSRDGAGIVRDVLLKGLWG